jgi:hypothetical protein
MLFGDKLNKTAEKFEDAGKQYETALDGQVPDAEKELSDAVEDTKKLADTNAGAGTFSAFDDYENMGTTIGDSLQKQLTLTAKTNFFLSTISSGIAEMNDESGRYS